MFHIMKDSLGGAEVGCGRCELGYCVRVVHLEQKIAYFYLLQDLYIDLCNDAGRWGVCLEFVDRLDLPVGRHGAQQILTSDCPGSDLNSFSRGRADDYKC